MFGVRLLVGVWGPTIKGFRFRLCASPGAKWVMIVFKEKPKHAREQNMLHENELEHELASGCM